MSKQLSILLHFLHILSYVDSDASIPPRQFRHLDTAASILTRRSRRRRWRSTRRSASRGGRRLAF
eukprot:462970-Pyramimonas_sp.AAC.1